jgi:flagellar hook-basal body complex protein FliE
MNIEAIAAIGALQPTMSASPTKSIGTPDFERWMTQQLNAVDQQIDGAGQSLIKLAAGEGNLHQVMLELEQARTSFQLTLQVRNKLLESYQELMRMQI